MKIDKHIPSPFGKTNPRYPLRKMEVGDSFFEAGEFTHLNASRAYMCAKTTQRRTDMDFQGKRVTEDGVRGIRIWRTA